jgi:hypothetical protein
MHHSSLNNQQGFPSGTVRHYIWRPPLQSKHYIHAVIPTTGCSTFMLVETSPQQQQQQQQQLIGVLAAGSRTA